VLEKVLFLVSRQRQDSRIELRREFTSDLPQVRADGAQLEQVFLNVCVNAFQSINGSGGRLVVRTLVQDENVCVEIEDDGPGIPAEVRQHIFTPFFTTRPNGTGLGLAISARLVGEQGGHIRFHCPPLGGTTFVITLPKEQAVPSAGAPPDQVTA
jgi:signal transduction histidine kinase